MTTKLQSYAIGTPVIVVRAMRVMYNPAERVFASKIVEKLEPHQDHPRYALEGQPGLAFFHHELFTEFVEAGRAIKAIEDAQREQIARLFDHAHKQLLALKLPPSA